MHDKGASATRSTYLTNLWLVVSLLSCPLMEGFATTLKHKRTDISISDLIASLDVEQKARAKDERSKTAKGRANAHMVQRTQSHGNRKGKEKKTKPSLPLLSRRRKRRVKAILCVVVLIIGKRSVHTTKKENLH